MSRSRIRSLAALMVAMVLSACAHSASVPAASASSSTSGVQSSAPPKSAVEAAKKDAARPHVPELSFTVPKGWFPVPHAQLHKGHDLAVLSPTSGIVFGRVEKASGPLPMYIALKAAKGLEQGFTVGEPTFAENGEWGYIAMQDAEGHFVAYGIKTILAEPAHVVLLFAQGPAEAGDEVTATVVSILTSLTVPSSAK